MTNRCPECRDRLAAAREPAHEHVCSVCGRCQRAATAPVPACAHCEDKIRGQLNSLVESYALLGDALALGSPAPSDGSRHTKADAAPLPVRLEVLNLRHKSGMVAVLESWEADWRETRGFEPTTAHYLTSTAATLVDIVAFLDAHLRWACENHPAMDEFAKEVRDLHNQCRMQLGDDERRFSPGPCPVTLDDGSACNRRLTVDPYGAGDVSCGATPPHSWPADTLMLLGRQLAEQQHEIVGAARENLA